MAIVFAGMGQADFLQIRNIPPWHKSRLLDRVVGTGPAVYEGELFGVANQMLSLFAAAGRFLLTVSGLVMWIAAPSILDQIVILSDDCQGHQTIAIHSHHKLEISLVQD